MPARRARSLWKPTTPRGPNCSIARALEVIGERWTLLILRDAFLGVRRFDDFQRSLGVARNVLNTRLQRLVDAGLVERRLYQERPERFEYRLTERGSDLYLVMLAMLRFGDDWLAGGLGRDEKPDFWLSEAKNGGASAKQAAVITPVHDAAVDVTVLPERRVLTLRLR